MPDTIKKITDKKDLPKSFCLENYAGTEHLDARGWAEALSMRGRVQSLHKHKLSDPDSDVIHDKFISTLFRDPLNQHTPSRFQISQTGLDWPALKHLTVNDLHVLTHFLETTKYEIDAKEVNAYFDNFWYTDISGQLSESARAFKSMTVDSMESVSPLIYHGDTINLAVDITSSDEQLIDEFRKILSDSRSSHNFNPRNSPFNKSSFKKWHNLAILPYLDLNLWAKANGVSIKPNVLSKAIYHHTDKEFGNSRTITEKVAPKALELLQRETLKVLCTQG